MSEVTSKPRGKRLGPALVKLVVGARAAVPEGVLKKATEDELVLLREHAVSVLGAVDAESQRRIAALGGKVGA